MTYYGFGEWRKVDTPIWTKTDFTPVNGWKYKKQEFGRGGRWIYFTKDRMEMITLLDFWDIKDNDIVDVRIIVGIDKPINNDKYSREDIYEFDKNLFNIKKNDAIKRIKKETLKAMRKF